MNRRLMTSAVLIHATACLVAFVASGDVDGPDAASEPIDATVPMAAALSEIEAVSFSESSLSGASSSNRSLEALPADFE